MNTAHQLLPFVLWNNLISSASVLIYHYGVAFSEYKIQFQKNIHTTKSYLCVHNKIFFK